MLIAKCPRDFRMGCEKLFTCGLFKEPNSGVKYYRKNMGNWTKCDGNSVARYPAQSAPRSKSQFVKLIFERL
jgi:hypothetical protein